VEEMGVSNTFDLCCYLNLCNIHDVFSNTNISLFFNLYSLKFGSACELKLQMLRHIRKRIGILTKQQDELEMRQSGLRSTVLSSSLHKHQENDDKDGIKHEDNDNDGVNDGNKDGDKEGDKDEDDEETGHVDGNKFDPSYDEKDNNNDDDDPLLPDEEGVEKIFSEKVETGSEPKFRYEDFDVIFHAKSLGFREEFDNMHDFVLGMGIEGK
jgi:hypothetical protein